MANEAANLRALFWGPSTLSNVLDFFWATFLFSDEPLLKTISYPIPGSLSFITYIKKWKIDGLCGIDIALNFGKLTLLEHSYSIQNWRHWSWLDDLGTICHKIHTLLLGAFCWLLDAPFVLSFKLEYDYPPTHKHNIPAFHMICIHSGHKGISTMTTNDPVCWWNSNYADIICLWTSN